MKEPRIPSLIGKLFGKKTIERVDIALKKDIVAEAILKDPPIAILVNGTWVEQEWKDDTLSVEQWKQQVAELFELIPADQQITVVDIHS